MATSKCTHLPFGRTAVQVASRPSPASHAMVLHAMAHKAPRWRTRRIEDVQQGDVVPARTLDGTVRAGRVSQVFRRTSQPTLLVRLSAVGGNYETVEVTAEHPFWAHGCWTPAHELQAGDVLTSLSNDFKVKVIDVGASGREQDVFNFEVAEYHNYHVGHSGVLVHNESKMLRPRTGTEADASKRFGKYYVPSGAHPLKHVIGASRTGQRISPIGLRPGLQLRTSAEFWLMGQLFRLEYEARQDFANLSGHAHGLAGSLAETPEGLGNRSISIQQPSINERLVGWRRREALPQFNDVDGWYPVGLTQDKIDALREHLFNTLGQREVDLAYAEYHANVCDAPAIQGIPMGSGILLFQPANAIFYASPGGLLPTPDPVTGRVPAVRIPGPWQLAGWHTLNLPKLPDRLRCDAGFPPYVPFGAQLLLVPTEN